MLKKVNENNHLFISYWLSIVLVLKGFQPFFHTYK